MDPALLALCVHEVQVLPVISTSGSGAREFGPARTVQARVQADQRRVVGRDGRKVASSTLLFLAPTDTSGVALTLGIDDKVVLPAGFIPQAPPIISIQPHYGATTALDHYEVRL